MFPSVCVFSYGRLKRKRFKKEKQIFLITQCAKMEAIESLDKECSALGGLFQQVVNEMKVRQIYFF